MKIAFFLLHYPVFSETFVSKEILNLQQLDLNGIIVCEKYTPLTPIQPYLKKIHFPLLKIDQKILSKKNIIPIILSHLYWFFKNPLAYLKSFYLFLNFFSFHHLRVFIKSPLLAKKLVIQNVDLIYIHEVDSPSLYGLICSQLLNIPCGIIIHTQYLFAQNKFLAAKIKYANFIIFQSRYSLKESQKISKLPQEYFSKCHILSTPGIDTNFFIPSKNQQFPSQIRLITIGRLEEAKGYPFLLSAIKKLIPLFPDIQLTIVGDGSQKSSFKKYIKKNKLQNNIHLVGYVGHTSKLIRLLHQHQYFILPSISDSQNFHDVHPNVVKEAMSCGLIVITSRLGGITEIIHHQQNAFLINQVNSQNIARIIKKVHLLSPSQKIKIATAARQTILKYHQQENICQQLKQIFITSINEK